jgi:hypothetical protein
LAGADAVEIVDPPEPAILRHEGILYDDVVAAGGFETRDVPGIDDLVIGARQEEDAAHGIATLVRDRAEKRPGAMLAAA